MSSTAATAADGRPGTDGHVPVLGPIGVPVTEAGLAWRAAEAEAFGGLGPDAIAAAHRWLD